MITARCMIINFIHTTTIERVSLCMIYAQTVSCLPISTVCMHRWKHAEATPSLHVNSGCYARTKKSANNGDVLTLLERRYWTIDRYSSSK